jgi:putative transposase
MVPSSWQATPKRRKGTTKQDKTAPKFPDRLKRDFTVPQANVRWCGDMTEIPTDEGKLYLPSWICSPASCWPARRRSIRMRNWPAMRSRWLLRWRGGRTVIDGVIFHTDYAEVGVKPRIGTVIQTV